MQRAFSFAMSAVLMCASTLTVRGDSPMLFSAMVQTDTTTTVYGAVVNPDGNANATWMAIGSPFLNDPGVKGIGMADGTSYVLGCTTTSTCGVWQFTFNGTSWNGASAPIVSVDHASLEKTVTGSDAGPGAVLTFLQGKLAVQTNATSIVLSNQCAVTPTTALTFSPATTLPALNWGTNFTVEPRTATTIQYRNVSCADDDNDCNYVYAVGSLSSSTFTMVNTTATVQNGFELFGFALSYGFEGYLTLGDSKSNALYALNATTLVTIPVTGVSYNEPCSGSIDQDDVGNATYANLTWPMADVDTTSSLTFQIGNTFYIVTPAGLVFSWTTGGAQVKNVTVGPSPGLGLTIQGGADDSYFWYIGQDTNNNSVVGVITVSPTPSAKSYTLPSWPIETYWFDGNYIYMQNLDDSSIWVQHYNANANTAKQVLKPLDGVPVDANVYIKPFDQLVSYTEPVLTSPCDSSGVDFCAAAAPPPGTVSAHPSAPPAAPTSSTTAVAVTLTLSAINATEAALLIANLNSTASQHGGSIVQALVEQYANVTSKALGQDTANVFVIPCEIVITDNSSMTTTVPVPASVIAYYVTLAAAKYPGITADVCSQKATSRKYSALVNTANTMTMNGAVVTTYSTTVTTTLQTTTSGATVSTMTTVVSSTIQTVAPSVTVNSGLSTSAKTETTPPMVPAPATPVTSPKAAAASHAAALLALISLLSLALLSAY